MNVRRTYSKRRSKRSGRKNKNKTKTKKRAQTGRGLGTMVKKGFSLAKRFANSRVGKALARKALGQAPKYYKKATSKIIVIIVNMGDKCISNLEIKRLIENCSNNNLKHNFVNVFASNEINYFISFHSLIKNRDVKYLFLISNTDRADRTGTHWWNIPYVHRKKE